MLQEVIDEKKEPPGELDVPIPIAIPRNLQNKAIYENGLSHLLHRLRLKVHSDLEDCHKLWEEFSPKRSIFHTWSYRMSWSKVYNLLPYFYTIYEGSTPLAVLPLSYSRERNLYTWFGSDVEWMEDNTFFAKDDKLVNLILKVLPRPIYLSAIEKIPDHLYENPFLEDEAKYVKDVSTYRSIDDYLASLSKKHRYNLKKDIAFIDSYRPRIEIVCDNDLKELDMLAKLAINRFTAKEEPNNFTEKIKMDSFRQNVMDAGEYKMRFLKVYIQNRLVASDMVMTYKKTYTVPRGGADSNRFPGIGNYMVYLNVKDALEHGFNVVDCLQTDDGGYKHRLLDRRSLMKYQLDYDYDAE